MTQFGIWEGGVPIPVGGTAEIAVPEDVQGIWLELADTATVPAVLTVQIKNGTRECWRRTFDVNFANDPFIRVKEGELIIIQNAADNASALVNGKWSYSEPSGTEPNLFFGEPVVAGPAHPVPRGAVWVNFCQLDPGFTATNAKQTLAATGAAAGDRFRVFLPQFNFGANGGVVWELAGR